MPLLLGSRLPGTMCRQLVARLVEGAFITDWGPATESPRSSYYEDDGYWRGPIWAPTTYLSGTDCAPGGACIGPGKSRRGSVHLPMHTVWRKLRRALGQGPSGSGIRLDVRSLPAAGAIPPRQTGEELKPHAATDHKDDSAGDGTVDCDGLQGSEAFSAGSPGDEGHVLDAAERVGYELNLHGVQLRTGKTYQVAAIMTAPGPKENEWEGVEYAQLLSGISWR